MKKFKFLFLTLIITQLQLFANETLEGIIETAEEDEQYNVTEVNLMVDRMAGGKLETRYYLINKIRGRGKELLTLSESRVRVRGRVKIGNDGNDILTVDSYEILDQHEPEPPDERSASEEDIGQDDSEMNHEAEDEYQEEP